MKWKRKNKSNPSRTDKIAGYLARFLAELQQRWASFMARRTATLSKETLQTGLVLFCIGFGGASLLLLRGAFSSDARLIEKPSTLTVPKYYQQPGLDLTPTLSPKDQEHIHRFITYLDNLSSSAEGRAIYDSIIRKRPGLLDSLQQMEAIFYSPSK